MDEPAYRAANRAIDDLVLDALDRHRRARPSSSPPRAPPLRANPAPAMQLYGSLKREQEERFAEWADRNHRRRAVIARLFNLSGPYINKHGSYALAAFILDALAGGPIRIRAPHRRRPLLRRHSRVDVLGVRPVARWRRTASPASTAAASRSRCRPSPRRSPAGSAMVAIDRPPLDPGHIDDYTGDGRRLRRTCSRSHRIAPVPLPQQVAETVDYLSFSHERSRRRQAGI